MMIYARVKKAKRKLAPKAVREQHEEWLQSVNKMTTNFSRGIKPVKKIEHSVLNQPQLIRQNANIPSLCSFDNTPALKRETRKYTGTKMLGIGTLHKSNAVPVFTENEAKDMAAMRR